MLRGDQLTEFFGRIEVFLFKDVRANCFCASLLRTRFTRHVMHRACALSSKVNNKWLRGFNDLGRSMADHLSQFSTFSEKMKKSIE